MLCDVYVKFVNDAVIGSVDFMSLDIHESIHSCVCSVAYVAQTVGMLSEGRLVQCVHAVTMLFLFNWPCPLYIL
jgi:hypothetical protein